MKRCAVTKTNGSVGSGIHFDSGTSNHYSYSIPASLRAVGHYHEIMRSDARTRGIGACTAGGTNRITVIIMLPGDLVSGVIKINYYVINAPVVKIGARIIILKP